MFLQSKIFMRFKVYMLQNYLNDLLEQKDDNTKIGEQMMEVFS